MGRTGQPLKNRHLLLGELRRAIALGLAVVVCGVIEMSSFSVLAFGAEDRQVLVNGHTNVQDMPVERGMDIFDDVRSFSLTSDGLASSDPDQDPEYQIPGSYRKISYAGVPKLSGCGFDLDANMSGLKTRMVAERLNVEQSYQTMSPLLSQKVQEFQAASGLPDSGIVDQETWLALGFSKFNWTDIDCYQSPLRITDSMTRSEIIEQFVATALAYQGSAYVWGGANRPFQGADCSGLVIQALNSVGINPAPYTTMSHAYPDVPTTRQIYADPSFKHVPISQVARGDLVFYKGTGTAIKHVGIYLGDGKIMEMATSAGGQISDWRRPGGMMPEAVRPLP